MNFNQVRTTAFGLVGFGASFAHEALRQTIIKASLRVDNPGRVEASELSEYGLTDASIRLARGCAIRAYDAWENRVRLWK